MNEINKEQLINEFITEMEYNFSDDDVRNLALPETYFLRNENGCLYAAINVKNRGVPNWIKVFTNLNIDPESINESFINNLWWRNVEDSFYLIAHQKYKMFSADDFTVIGRSGGYWGVRIDNKNCITIKKEKVEQYLDNILRENKNITRNEIERILNRLNYYNSMTFKSDFLSDLNDIATTVKKIIAELESTKYWVDQLKESKNITI